MNSRAYPPPETTRSKGPILLLLGVLLLLGALLPAAMWLDSGIDEDRKMYLDRQTMAFLQHQNVVAGVAPVATSLEPEEELAIGPFTFRSEPGISVEVTTETTTDEEGAPFYSYCVRASNEDGDETPWLCHDLNDPPAAPTGDPLAEV